MNLVLRTLEQWTTYQDYLWFLAALAWSAVVAAEFWRKEKSEPASPIGWLMVLAASYAAGAALELVLLAQDLMMPYTRFDAAMGGAQALGTGALVWGATSNLRGREWWRGFAAAGLAGLAVWRLFAPVEAGYLLAIAQAGVVLHLLRQPWRPISAAAGAWLALAPIVATHGAWAYAVSEGRKTADFSHFGLVAAAFSLGTGAVFAAAAWQRRLKQVVPEGNAGAVLSRTLQRAVLLLVVWLIGGVLLAVWYGRVARRAFEENLLRRIETCVVALDPQLVAEALGPDLRITSIRRMHYADGRRRPVNVAQVPRTAEPMYAELRRQLGRVRAANPDFKYFHIQTPRQGQMLVFNFQPRRDSDVRHVIHHALTPTDLDRITTRKSFLEGPVKPESWVATFAANAPLFHPESGQFLGWLVAEVAATRWLATFTQARLQTMALVGAGVGLWVLAVAYRLRRESRDAAERKAATADAADRMKSAFLAKVSHELRTPIQSVLGYGELLASAPLSEQHRAWLTGLQSHGDIMLRLVNDLIDLGALQSGAFRLEPAPVALRTLVDECTAALRPAVAAKRLAFHVEIGASVPPWVRADGVRVRQVLLNLLNNAVKFTPAGSVSLAVRRMDDPHIEFVVADTGPGIPGAMRPRLFQPFARLDPAAGEGSGLGLALVQGLCTAMEGSVQLAEPAGSGATFSVRLPLAPCEPPTSTFAAPRGATPAFAGLRVLVAEDNTLVRELLIAFLAENGAEVTVAVDGPTALALALDRTPDVLLLDIALPGLDGIGVATRVRCASPRRLRIIGLSAHASASDEARARGAGMDEFLAKPVRLARLAEALTQNRETLRSIPLSESISDDTLRSRLALQFASETPGLLAELRTAVATTDWSRVRSRAHYLKNSADVLGATRLQDACQRLAVLGESPDPAVAQCLLDAVEAAIPAKLLVSCSVAAVDKN